MRTNPLRQQVFTLLVVVSIFLAFLGYWALLLDWMPDFRTGEYIHQPVEAAYKTAAYLLYLFLGVRFLTNRIRFF